MASELLVGWRLWGKELMSRTAANVSKLTAEDESRTLVACSLAAEYKAFNVSDIKCQILNRQALVVICVLELHVLKALSN